MQQAQQRLKNLLELGKISKNDFKLLSNAFDKKQQSQKSFVEFLLNPYQKISGMQALLYGFIVILILSALGLKSATNFYDILMINYQIVSLPHLYFSTFIKLVGQNLIACLLMGLIFLLAALIGQQKNLRIIDFIGMVMLAKFPQLIVLIFANIFFEWFGINHVIAINNPHSILLNLFRIVNLLGTLWVFFLYFNAFKEASGLTKYKLYLSFVVSLTISYVLVLFILRQLFAGLI